MSAPATIDLSLDRIHTLLGQLGQPQRRFPVIHVAGTNAKGSTIFYLDRILRNVVGVQTATFTSPHLRVERDACTVNGVTIDESVWNQATEIVDASPASSPCTPFEKLTARSFVAFDLIKNSQRPDVLLVEVGMGGALDATNVFADDQVLASVITSVDFDHQAMLGNTLAEIAAQKAGIVKQGGLCIVADQRREHAERQEREVDCLRVASSPDSDERMQVMQSVRRLCIERQARLVKQQTPWYALQQQTAPLSPSQWQTVVRSNVRFSPTLRASKVHKDDFVASTGDNVVAGPELHALPATRAALMGAHVALQTLFSIARDESPYAHGAYGNDAFEDLRLQIAFALRDDRFARRTLEQALEQSTGLAGRAEWVEIELPGESNAEKADEEMEVESEVKEDAHAEGAVEEELPQTQPPAQSVAPPSQNLTALVDGAHNPSAASALRQYIDTCLSSHNEVTSNGITITWVLGFSQGKDITEMAKALLGNDGEAASSLSDKVEALSLSAKQVRHRIACVPFTTPVEGMPWVQCVSPEDAKARLSSTLSQAAVGVEEIESFDGQDATSAIQGALRWALKAGTGSPSDSSVIVVAGSLYLVSDIHRSFAKQ